MAIPQGFRKAAIEWLENEAIDWQEETKRRLRRDKEIALLRKARPATANSDQKSESHLEPDT